MQSTAKKLKLPLDKLIVTVDEHGNTSAASIPLALDVAVRSGKIKRGDTRHARRRRRRLHLGRGVARLLSDLRSPCRGANSNDDFNMTSFAFVFPGQGSQSVGMLDAFGDHPAVQQTLARGVRCARRGHRPPDP